ncbi:LysR substrate-binding domain-containing protein [Bordetella trematum]|uniref:LysR substrate-binding domain-containing protein n=1 Tax=Bordetella trematum TaxID=123899 RepID=UPI000D8D286F|nr:LysR substrate-binding domain-containing protein [Bordetella trematum]SPU49248.1 LysR family transcriptional regulator [Bordetella trematum]VDH03871.1 Gcv operon activator [Bordetella trematum]
MITLRKLTPSMAQLLAFDAAARLGSFTAAANDLCLTQSAISRHVQELEGMLQAALFERKGPRIALTPEGARYAHSISDALTRIRRASLDIYESRPQGESLRLAVLPIFSSKWLMPRLGEFQSRHPEILIHLQSRTGAIEKSFQGVDACIAVGDGHWPHLVGHHLISTQGIIIGAPDLLARRPLLRVADLRQHQLLEANTPTSGWRDCLLDNGLDPRIARAGSRFEYTAHLIQAVINGSGLGLVTDLFVQEELRNGVLTAASLPGFRLPAKHYHLLYPPENAASSALQAFVAWVRETAARPG